MKVALIGLGRWGKILLKELEGHAEVKYRYDSKDDLNTVWDDPEIDAVFIATPTKTHFNIAGSAINSGKHVFLEKPGTERSEDLEKLITMAEKNNIKLAIGYEFPHQQAFRKLKDIISGKKIEKIVFEWLKWGSFKDDPIIHLLCHEISIMKSLGFEKITPLSCKSMGVISESDLIWTDFECDDGIQVKSFINRVSPIKSKSVMIVLRDRGYVLNENGLFEINKESQTLEKIESDRKTPVSKEIHAFLSSISEEKELETSGKFGRDVLKIVEKIKLLPRA